MNQRESLADTMQCENDLFKRILFAHDASPDTRTHPEGVDRTLVTARGGHIVSAQCRNSIIRSFDP